MVKQILYLAAIPIRIGFVNELAYGGPMTFLKCMHVGLT